MFWGGCPPPLAPPSTGGLRTVSILYRRGRVRCAQALICDRLFSPWIFTPLALRLVETSGEGMPEVGHWNNAFLSVADCYEGRSRVEELRTVAAALAIKGSDNCSHSVWTENFAPLLPEHAQPAVRRGTGALYAALRGMRQAWLSRAIRVWAISATAIAADNAIAAAECKVSTEVVDRLAVEKLTLTSELAVLSVEMTTLDASIAHDREDRRTREAQSTEVDESDLDEVVPRASVSADRVEAGKAVVDQSSPQTRRQRSLPSSHRSTPRRSAAATLAMLGHVSATTFDEDVRERTDSLDTDARVGSPSLLSSHTGLEFSRAPSRRQPLQSGSSDACTVVPRSSRSSRDSAPPGPASYTTPDGPRASARHPGPGRYH